MRLTVEERLKKYSQISSTGCIEWIGYKQGGYGILRIKGKNVHVHRLVWELANGKIPEGMFICHRCDNPLCINLGHLFLGSCADNNQDCAKKGHHHNSIKTHCLNGHLLTGDNLSIKDGHRRCKACDRERSARKRAIIYLNSKKYNKVYKEL